MGGERLHEAMARAEEAWRERWESEQPEGTRRKYHYTVEFDCTYEVWESVMAALKGFPISNRHYRQNEIGRE